MTHPPATQYAKDFSRLARGQRPSRIRQIRPQYLSLYYSTNSVETGMEYVYAALLLHKLQKDVNEENISNVVRASGAEVNDAQVKALVASLADVNIEEAIKAEPIAVAAAPQETKSEDKKEEPKEKPKDEGKTEEAAMEGLSSLFG